MRHESVLDQFKQTMDASVQLNADYSQKIDEIRTQQQQLNTKLLELVQEMKRSREYQSSLDVDMFDEMDTSLPDDYQTNEMNISLSADTHNIESQKIARRVEKHLHKSVSESMVLFPSVVSDDLFEDFG